MELLKTQDIAILLYPVFSKKLFACQPHICIFLTFFLKKSKKIPPTCVGGKDACGYIAL